MSDIAILLLAAGASVRMRGRDKLTEEVDGMPLLSLMVSRARDTGYPVFVSLPDASHPRAALISGATPVFVPDAAEGMAASIRTGVSALPASTQAVMIVPADMPDLEMDDFLFVAKHLESHDAIVRATSFSGQPGHPVLFPRPYFAELQSMTGDSGAHSILRANAHRIKYVALPDDRACTDLDTPDAWATWRAKRPR